MYHSFLALVENKGYSSKNHIATVIFILKHYVDFDVSELELLEKLEISKTDAEFYTQLKDDRTNASYSTSYSFDDEKVISLNKKVKKLLFKIKEVIKVN